ncbi:hypothetical protein ANANG_G00230970 [Anguilla anguilla]|uniref:DNA topoisomerase n=1 Tax=Anguilla anguilla TaxID=7936 RepID=A0A9D3M1E4_ANGAN|nr:hypothetical protein ANANG_G00230970 [Anguilla anguilla]
MRPIKIMKEEEGNQQRRWYRGRYKWKFLEHRGPLFIAECQPLPDGVSFYYDEEVAFFYAQMLDHEYTAKEVFRNNFLTDWRKEMTPEESMLIIDLDKYDFGELFNLHKRRVEAQHVQGGETGGRGIITRWKEVRHDNIITWLASWTENMQSSCEYITLHASSKLKGEKDWEKYEVARRLSSYVDQIRSQYYQDMDSKEMLIRQRATALYFIDKVSGGRDFLSETAGPEGGEREGGGETADTVGCCSLRVEHLTLHRHLGEDEYVVEFDFPGKDSICYCSRVPVVKRTSTLNKYLSSLMPGLTAKVFRTYNASITLQKRLAELSCKSDGQAEKLLAYNRANCAVLCNHQRAEPKSFEQSMASLQTKINSKTQDLAQAKTDLTLAKWKAKGPAHATDREEGKQIALGTSKLNYLDPRITLA